MKYRSKTDIVAQMLIVAGDGQVTKTKIMYHAFLSFAQLREYLALLIENGLIDHDSKHDLYRTTEKGRRFVSIYQNMGNFITPLQRER